MRVFLFILEVGYNFVWNSLVQIIGFYEVYLLDNVKGIFINLIFFFNREIQGDLKSIGIDMLVFERE